MSWYTLAFLPWGALSREGAKAERLYCLGGPQKRKAKMQGKRPRCKEKAATTNQEEGQYEQPQWYKQKCQPIKTLTTDNWFGACLLAFLFVSFLLAFLLLILSWCCYLHHVPMRAWAPTPLKWACLHNDFDNRVCGFPSPGLTSLSCLPKRSLSHLGPKTFEMSLFT